MSVAQSNTTLVSADFEAPLLMMKASTDGIVEYQANHFDGQLRGNLIAAKCTDGRFRVVLTDDGLNVVAESVQVLPLVGDLGLDVTQATNRSLIKVRLPSNALYYHKPVEEITSHVRIVSVFPSLGSNAGDSSLHICGVNLDSGSNVTVNIGNNMCAVQTLTATIIACVLLGGADVTISSDAGLYIYLKRVIDTFQGSDQQK